MLTDAAPAPTVAVVPVAAARAVAVGSAGSGCGQSRGVNGSTQGGTARIVFFGPRRRLVATVVATAIVVAAAASAASGCKPHDKPTPRDGLGAGGAKRSEEKLCRQRRV